MPGRPRQAAEESAERSWLQGHLLPRQRKGDLPARSAQQDQGAGELGPDVRDGQGEAVLQSRATQARAALARGTGDARPGCPRGGGPVLCALRRGLRDVARSHQDHCAARLPDQPGQGVGLARRAQLPARLLGPAAHRARVPRAPPPVHAGERRRLYPQRHPARRRRAQHRPAHRRQRRGQVDHSAHGMPTSLGECR